MKYNLATNIIIFLIIFQTCISDTIYIESEDKERLFF